MGHGNFDRLAIPPIDTVVADMVLMAERHRLFERFVQSAWMTGQRTQKYYAGCDHHRRQQAQAEKKSESPTKKLRHVDRPIAFLLLENVRGAPDRPCATSACVSGQTFRGHLNKRSF
jgi:hypothetical protein